MDRNSDARGVRQFKTSLLKRLEQDEETTIRKRKETSDIRELRRVYLAYKDYITKHGKSFEFDNREKLTNARRIASLLYDVLKTIISAARVWLNGDRNFVGGKSDFYVPYNILPLNHGSIQHTVMRLPEIKAAVAAVRDMRSLPSSHDLGKDIASVDLLDLLQGFFGFQNGNVANQRDHLILLLANAHIRLNNKGRGGVILKTMDAVCDELMKKFFKNYTNWCRFLGRKSYIRLPMGEAQQYKLLYIGLYLLIWGEGCKLALYA